MRIRVFGDIKPLAKLPTTSITFHEGKNTGSEMISSTTNHSGKPLIVGYTCLSECVIPVTDELSELLSCITTSNQNQATKSSADRDSQNCRLYTHTSNDVKYRFEAQPHR